MVKSRLRSLGCSPCTGAIRSDAETIPDIIAELISFRSSERANRVIDHDQEGSMEIEEAGGLLLNGELSRLQLFRLTSFCARSARRICCAFPRRAAWTTASPR